MNLVDFSTLSPQPVWQHFHTLCNIPRPSKHEQQLREHLKHWAEQRGLDTDVDEIGNLIIRKPASRGMEHTTGVILQGHLDMVTQANSGTVHDFSKDPIQPVIEEGWLIAKDTTLGADNGIGVALALAVLESKDLAHGPIEALFTIDEEAGMSGARHLEAGILQGQWLFNIDTEEWGELYLGCAGSLDVEVSESIDYIAAPENLSAFEINLSGLKGGHSGVQIHLGRGNANVILAQFLQQHLSELDGYLVEFHGGTARNAIPREAFATIAIAADQIEALQQRLNLYLQHCQNQLKGIDDGLNINIKASTTSIEQVMERRQQQLWLDALASCPYGVASISQVLDNVVEISNNIGVVRIGPEGGQILIMVRAMDNHEVQDFSQKIQQHFAQYGLQAKLAHLVSGWTPDPESAALKCLQQAYQQAFQIEPQLKVIHAGLECGIIAQHYPHLQMVSFGPDIQGAHAPGERVNIKSVENCWTLLTAALALVK
ncbi:aminoacyl-histidine dipeptidase [Acinetobacter puyangensis]|uniref:Cytosol non-specific dipeptidase n=1 Tax=Acinetobacter puyangensis TaxID=1096779 RepID=A0A240EF24_9GAMM|nr:aminoacyl-histidine dipeptidase [Acinetobacter puyangensis]SNX46530.1 dipeptidase D [Acinetobacter puyangensis]